jgi:hypothetical protein
VAKREVLSIFTRREWRPRSERRKRAGWVAWLEYSDRSPSIRCVVTDISADGARVIPDRPVEEGAELTLWIPQSRLRMAVQLVWADDGSAGLQFRFADNATVTDKPA